MAQIHEHDAISILPHLATHLPHSITCLRRIQHGQAYPSPTAKILATFPPGSTPDTDTPWLAGRVDLFLGRATQIVLYSSLESRTSIAPIAPVTQSDGATTVSTLDASPAQLDIARDQLLALLRYVKRNLLPEYLSTLPVESAAAAAAPAQSNGVPLIPPPSPNAFLLGSLHTGLFALLMRSGIFPAQGAEADILPGLKVHRFDNPPYFKYFFPRAVFGVPGDAALPTGYRYHDRLGRSGVLPEHLDLVQSRTHIPRPRAQLLTMPGVAVYHEDGEGDEMPIAWGFLGVDGAVATLHVEPEHRRKGLALALSKQVMRRGMADEGTFGAERSCISDVTVREKVGGWVHTEVAQYNGASRRVMEKIGGEVLTTAMWTVIELCD